VPEAEVHDDAVDDALVEALRFELVPVERPLLECDAFVNRREGA
jgi:hypothetical protein